jgi:hypothetical protein
MTPDDNSNSEIAALKNQVFTLLVALIVVSGTLTVFLYHQASSEGKELNAARALDAGMSTNEVMFTTFVNRLVAYGEKHPDFVPVLKKYGIAPVPGVPASVMVPGGVPATPAVPKK